MSEFELGPRWFPQIGKAALRCRPISKPVVRQAVKDMEEAKDKSLAAGLSENEAAQDGFDAYNLAIAKGVVIDWTGINNGGKPVEFSPDNLDLYLSQPQALLRFSETYIADYVEQRSEKNGLSPSVSISTSEAGENTAKTA